MDRSDTIFRMAIKESVTRPLNEQYPVQLPTGSNIHSKEAFVS